jgi:hypothetical protein
MRIVKELSFNRKKEELENFMDESHDFFLTIEASKCPENQI